MTTAELSVLVTERFKGVPALKSNIGIHEIGKADSRLAGNATLGQSGFWIPTAEMVDLINKADAAAE